MPVGINTENAEIPRMARPFPVIRVLRSMNDLLKLTPQASTVGGFSVGGGNFRQRY